MPVSPALGLTISSFAVGVGLTTICLKFGMLQSKAVLAGLLAFMAMRIFTGWLYNRVGREKK